MTKDPAFLFYSQDFLVGTMTMPFEDKGKYITILCFMHQNGPISDETIRLLVGNTTTSLMSKFTKCEDGLWHNERLETEVKKRIKFTESRKNNGLKGGRPAKNQTVTKSKTNRLSLAKPKNNLPEDVNESDNDIKIIVDYLNEKVSSNFKSKTKNTVEVINARIKEGYTVDNFKTVIDKKADEWLTNPKMAIHLKPETLFGNKFDGYLNQPAAIPQLSESATSNRGATAATAFSNTIMNQ